MCFNKPGPWCPNLAAGVARRHQDVGCRWTDQGSCSPARINSAVRKHVDRGRSLLHPRYQYCGIPILAQSSQVWNQLSICQRNFVHATTNQLSNLKTFPEHNGLDSIYFRPLSKLWKLSTAGCRSCRSKHSKYWFFINLFVEKMSKIQKEPISWRIKGLRILPT